MDAYQKFIQDHSADLTQVGFDYQFYCFLLAMFNINPYDSITYEGEDDIEIRTTNGKIHLIQVKHSVNVPSEKLTDLDVDLWKTIETWIKQSEAYQKSRQNGSSSFFDQYTFTLVTNKEPKCRFVEMHEKYMRHDITEKDIKKYVTSIASDSGEHTQARLNALLSLGDLEFRKFLNNFSFRYVPNSLQSLVTLLRRIYCSDQHACDVLHKLNGKILDEKYNKATKKIKLEYTRREFEKANVTILQGENPNLPEMLSEYNDCPEIPDNFAQMNLFQQLKLIDIVDLDDITDEEIPMNYARFLHYINNIDFLTSESLIDSTYVKNLEKDARAIWDGIFTQKHRDFKRKIKDPGIDKNRCCLEQGYNCFADTMEKTIKNFDIYFSNGCFLKLSNDTPPEIGWHLDWKSLIH